MRLGITSLTKLTSSLNIDWFNSLQTWHRTGEVHFTTVPRYSEGIRYWWYQGTFIDTSYWMIHIHLTEYLLYKVYLKTSTKNMVQMFYWYIAWKYHDVYYKVSSDTTNVPWYYHSTFSGAPRQFHKYHSSPISPKSRYFREYHDICPKLHGFIMLHVQKHMK